MAAECERRHFGIPEWWSSLVVLLLFVTLGIWLRPVLDFRLRNMRVG